MLVAFWAVKGGVGTTVTAALCALCWTPEREVLLVDLEGDLPAALGCPIPQGPGCTEWLGEGADAEPAALQRLERPVAEGLHLLPRGEGGLASGPAVATLAAELSADDRVVVVDCGVPPLGIEPDHPVPALLARAEHSWMVVRACYLGLTRAARGVEKPTGVVLVREEGRALDRRDVTTALGHPVVAEIAADPCIARSVDAGLLSTRLPHRLRRVLGGVCPSG